MKLNKKILSIFFIALFAIALVACGETTISSEIVETTETTEITETTETTEVTETTETTEPVVTTEPEEIDWAALEALLKTDYQATLDNEEFVATEDLTLITSIGDATITWESSNTAYLGHDGTVTRPSFTEGDKTVTLTATLTIGAETYDVMFFVTIGKLDKTDQERANEVLDKVMVFPFKEKWSSADSATLEFLTEGKDADNNVYTVTWTSSNPEIIALDGTIVQPEGEDVVVIMTATVNIGGVDFTRTKDFTVAKQAEATVVTSFAEAIALGKDAYVKIQGVTYLSKVSNGYYFTDGVNNLFVFTSGLTIETGDVVDLTGIVAEYYGYAQLAGSTEKPVLVTPSEAAAKEPVIVDSTIEYIIANCTAENGDMKLHTMYRITGRVYHASNYDDPVYLVPSDYDFVNNFSADAKPIGNAIEIYDYSNDTLLIPFHGKEVTIVVLPLGFHTGHSNHHANFIGNAEDIIVAIEDDQEAVDTALAALDYPGVIVEDTTLEFPASLFGVTLTYTSSDIAIDVTTGLVDAASQTTQITVTITVDAERGTATGQKVFTIKVGELSVSTLAEVLAGSNNDLFKVQATIIGGGYNTYFIQDDTGALALYVASDLRTFFSENVGNVVEIVGTRDTYNGLNQISVQTATFVEAGTLWSSENVDAIELNSTNLLPYQSHLIELTAMEVVSTSTDSNGNITLVLKDLRDNTTVAARWDSRYSVSTEFSTLLASLVQGDIINIQAILGWFNNPQLTISAQTVITMTTDAEKLAADVAYLPATIETTSGATEMAPLVGPYGSTFVWDATEITNAGGTFDPLTGEITYPEVLVDTVYNVTGTASLGSETPVNLSLAITVLAMTDAEKLAAAIADTGIDEDCDGYQVVMLPLTGLYGTTISWTIVSGDATLDVDGTTLTYNQGTMVADVVLEATFVNGLESQAVQFTVTVTPATIVTDLSTLHTMTGEAYDVTGEVFVQGIITAIDYRTIFIQDENGVGFTLYNTLATVSGVVQNPNNLAIGDEVVFYGTLAAYNSARQISGAAFKEKLSVENPLIVIPMTADQIIALTPADAGKLISFEGFVIQSWDGYNVNLSVIGTSETITVSLRGYANGTPWLKDVFDVNDVLPSVNIIFYNIYKLGEPNEALNFSYITIEAGNQAFAGYEATLADALTYTYLDYDYHYDTIAVDGYSIHLEYLQSTLLEANSTDMYEGIMFDLARFLGSIYRVEGSVTSLEYNGVEYTWSETLGLQGSNWVQADGTTTLVSVIVTDFTLGNVTDGIVVKLMDGSIYSANLDLTFNVTMDLDAAIETTIAAAILYEYVEPDAYTYFYETSVYADYTLTTVYLDENVSLDFHEIMWDMARFLGALYRVQDSNVASIVYKGQEYTWNELLGLHGSNWAYYDEGLMDDVTLVSVIVDDFQAALITDTVALTLKDAGGYGLNIDLTFSVEGEVVPVESLAYTDNFGTVPKTGYALGTVTYTNGEEDTLTLDKDRMQINTSTSAPHTSQGAFVVMAPISGALVSYFEYDLSTYADISKIELSLSSWSATSGTNVNNMSLATIKLQLWDSINEVWMDVDTTLGSANFISLVDSTQYTLVTFETTTAGLYRVVYTLDASEGTSTSNTRYALTIDDFKIYETK